MTTEIAIKVDNLSKCYKIYENPKDRLKELLSLFGKSYHKKFWALDDLNFEIKKGDRVGIIGPNGSGKSTLLQVICGILQANKGDLEVNGTISALLELGAGFNPEFSGRENVYMNGALKGLSKEQMDERFERIADFADIGDFIERPTKTYSTGMFVRLAFACAVNIDPDILIIDEALAVGDLSFHRKCLNKFEEFKKKNVTVLLVSHSLSAVEGMCNKAIYLEHGKIVKQGDPADVIVCYEDRQRKKDKKKLEEKEEQKAPGKTQGLRSVTGSGEVSILSIGLFNGAGEKTDYFLDNDKMVIEIEYNASERVNEPAFGFSLNRSDGIHACAATSKHADLTIDYIEGKGKVRLTMYPIQVIPGIYRIGASIRDKDLILHYDLKLSGYLEIGTTKTDINPLHYGVFFPIVEWSIEK